MAFFGLTALGPQNTFSALSKNHRNIQIFEENDFCQAWKTVTGDRTFCPKEQIQDILEQLFRGPVPEPDLEPALDAFYGVDDGSGLIAFDTFMKIMVYLQREAEHTEEEMLAKPRPGCELVSSQQFRESVRKNAAIKKDFQTKLIAPLTSTQEYGWDPQNPKPPVAGRSGSDITKFASELIKNGIYY
eukprot:gene10810-12015_t